MRKKSFLPAALFIAFFPQLVAGPIVRAQEFFEGLYQWRAPNEEERLRGVLLMALGLVKKMALADQFAQIAEAYFQNPSAQPGMVSAWTGTASFALQIFFDFSGYTDMAIGMALLLGFHFPVNFRRPYLAFSITDFWHRWHISLSRWLRDYLYIPLGGSRGTVAKTYRNLMLTMLLGGLWHGAAWNFLLWGLFHGAILCVHRAIAGERGRDAQSTLAHFAAMTGFFAVTCYGWLLFRASSFRQVVQFTQILFVDFGNLALTMPMPTFAALVGLPILLLFEIADYRSGLNQAYSRISPIMKGAVSAALIFALLTGTSNAPQQFIYFQF